MLLWLWLLWPVRALRHAGQARSPAVIRAGLEAEFDKFTIWPQGASAAPVAG